MAGRHLRVAGRLVVFDAGRGPRPKTQSVNICTTANLPGDYEQIVRLPAGAVDAETIERFSSIPELVNTLVHKYGGHSVDPHRRAAVARRNREGMFVETWRSKSLREQIIATVVGGLILAAIVGAIAFAMSKLSDDSIRISVGCTGPPRLPPKTLITLTYDIESSTDADVALAAGLYDEAGVDLSSGTGDDDNVSLQAGHNREIGHFRVPDELPRGFYELTGGDLAGQKDWRRGYRDARGRRLPDIHHSIVVAT